MLFHLMLTASVKICTLFWIPTLEMKFSSEVMYYACKPNFHATLQMNISLTLNAHFWLLDLYLYYAIFRDQGAFYNFVDAIVATGGGDGPEDIMGGLQAAFSMLSWGDKEVCKVNHSYFCIILNAYFVL